MWKNPKFAALPDGCCVCKWCGKMCMEAEMLEDDWYGRGQVIRIFSMCDDAPWTKDESRTEFATENEAVQEWNDINSEI